MLRRLRNQKRSLTKQKDLRPWHTQQYKKQLYEIQKYKYTINTKQFQRLPSYMQKSSRIMQPQYAPNQQSNNLNQFCHYKASSKTKTTENNYKQSPTSSIQVGDKYTYSLKDMIGDGYTSKVYKGHEIGKPTTIYAIKVIDKKRLDQDQIKLIKNQLDLHPTLKHPNIVQCYDVYDTDNLIYIVLEWCNSGDLAQYIKESKNKAITELKAIQIMEQVLSGCRYLLQQGVLHRDLKPANILRQGNKLKIADFGFATKGKKTLIDSMSVGTPLYMPPESIEQCVYSHKSDFFSLGCIMYELVNGRTPWYKIDEKALAQSMKTNKIDLSRIRNENIKYFIEKTCEISQGSRMSVDQFMSFDFKKAQTPLDFSLVGFKQKVLSRHHTQRLIFNRSPKAQDAPKTVNMAKSIIHAKQQAIMEATFISNHIYFKGAKCEEVKRITAELEEKFQFCLLLKYLLQNSTESILVEETHQKSLKIVLFRHCIFTFKRLINDFVRTKSFDLKNWCQYRESNEFKKFQQECKVMKQKTEKEFNLQLKGMSLKSLGEVNKKFPELTSQYNLSKSFYEKLKQFLREIICQFNQQLVKKFKKQSSIGRKQNSQNLSLYYEAFKSLSRYYEYCEQKQQQQSIGKSLTWSSKMSIKEQKVMERHETRINSHYIPSDKFPQRMKGYDELGFGKVELFRHLSPDCEKQNLLQNSTKTTICNFKRALQKRVIHNAVKSPALKHQSGNLTMQPHYFSSNVEPTVSGFDLGFNTQRLEKMVYIQSPKRKVNFLQVEKINQIKQQQQLNTVESHFAKNLCRNFQQSTMTKEQYLTIKRKLRWLW